MIEYTLLDEATQRVLETGVREDFNGLASPGVVVMAGRAPEGEVWHDGQAFQHVPPQPGPHHVWCWEAHLWRDLWAAVREQRAPLLEASDLVARAAEQRGEALSLPWRQYRQALRDITRQADPRAVVWPTQPTKE